MAKSSIVHAEHILEAIDNIDADLADHDFDSFRTSRRARQLAERNLEVISEASRRLPAELKEKHPHIHWRAIAGIGNVLRHDYHRTHPIVLWDTCTGDLAPLKDAVTQILRELNEDNT